MLVVLNQISSTVLFILLEYFKNIDNLHEEFCVLTALCICETNYEMGTQNLCTTERERKGTREIGTLCILVVARTHI